MSYVDVCIRNSCIDIQSLCTALLVRRSFIILQYQPNFIENRKLDRRQQDNTKNTLAAWKVVACSNYMKRVLMSSSYRHFMCV